MTEIKTEAERGSDARVRVILDCDWNDLQYALDMMLEAKPSFDRHPNRPGWGWHFSRRGKPTLFIRQTKGGFSASSQPARSLLTRIKSESGGSHE